MVTKIQTDAIGLAAFLLVCGGWIFFALVFLMRKKPPKVEEAKRAPASRWGIVLQGVGFAAVWTFRRSKWWPFSPSVGGELLLATVAVALAWASSFWCLASVRTLGKQWAYQARVIKGHELITAGPYKIVRNPIYLGMFGMMLSTGLAYSTWWALLAGIIPFLIGVQIRITAEEKLLRESFGSQFDDYARRVPAFVPRIP
jgi:protein-S-isoprenylcysteine O-methyltransferase Ste14